jgi:hypothetical protein
MGPFCSDRLSRLTRSLQRKRRVAIPKRCVWQARRRRRIYFAAISDSIRAAVSGNPSPAA